MYLNCCDICLELGIVVLVWICRIVCVCMNWDWVCVIGVAEWNDEIDVVLGGYHVVLVVVYDHGCCCYA